MFFSALLKEVCDETDLGVVVQRTQIRVQKTPLAARHHCLSQRRNYLAGGDVINNSAKEPGSD
jgi:hypothetical protein